MAFLPTNVPTCVLWLDPTDETTETLVGGVYLEQWRDKVSSIEFDYYNGYAILYRDVTNGQSAFRFTGIESVNNSTFVFPNTAYSLFAIANLSFSSSYRRLLNGGGYAGDNLLFLGAFDNTAACFTGAGTWNDTDGVGVSIQNSYNLVEMVVDGSSLSVYVNGTFYTSKVGTTGAFTGLNIGGFAASVPGGEQAWPGDCGDIALYSTALPQPERQQVEGCLAWKWGIQSSLPSDHPYRNAPPSVFTNVPLGVYSAEAIQLQGPPTLPYLLPSGATAQTTSILPPVVPSGPLPAQIVRKSWFPNQIADLVLWLDAADQTTVLVSESDVLQWNDKSGRGNNTTGSFGYPQYVANLLNKYPGITFNGSTAYFEILPVITQDWSIFLVLSTTSTAGDGPQWYSGNGIFDAEYTGTTYDFGTSLNGASFSVGVGNPPTGDDTLTSSVAINTGAGTLCEFLRTSSTGFFENLVNGTSQGSITGGTGTRTTVSRITIGALQTLTTFFNGTIYEIVVYTAPLSTSDRQKVEGYLAWKWKFPLSLPPTHPYRLFPPPPEPTVPYSYTVTSFTYTGSDQTFTVPTGIFSLQVYLWGAGGGSGGDVDGYGGAGAMVQGVLSVTPGDTFTIIVGQGGYFSAALTPYGGGGAGTNIGAGTSGAGGGRSAIQLAGNDIVTAGGGGGGGYSTTQGGKGTFSGTADSGSGGSNGGGGGTQTEGGAAGTGAIYGSPATPGTQYQGGNGSGFGGGGGGGYYGGGGASSDVGAGGGGGSSYSDGLTLLPGASVFGYSSVDGYSAPNSSSPYWVSPVAQGAPKENNGGNGLVVLRY